MHHRLFLVITLSTLSLLVLCTDADAQSKRTALIIDGQNNHSMWPKTTVMMKQYLEETDLFSVDIARTKYTWQGNDLLDKYPLPGVTTESTAEPTPDPSFRPEFSKYDVVVSNFGWRAAEWPKATQQALNDFVAGGGGLVIVHAANNSFGNWPEFNQMIGLGGWDNRNETSGPYVYFNRVGKLVRDKSPGTGGSHGSQHPFQIVIRDVDHPIVKGMPRAWMHTKDELYDRLRGPAENMQVLATAYSAESQGGSGRHEPMILIVNFGKGRVFHTPLGHADYSQECVGFITTFQRGTEWAATGIVTQGIPEDFPSRNEVSKRSFGG